MAPPGPPFAWQPPRTVRPREVPDRSKRVSALGDAVVPQQAALAIALLRQPMQAPADLGELAPTGTNPSTSTGGGF